MTFTKNLTVLTLGAMLATGLMFNIRTAEGQAPAAGEAQRIRAAEERLRLLYDQRNYREAVDEAELLLAIDPSNSTAFLFKTMSETRIARRESGDMPATTGAAVPAIPSAGPGLRPSTTTPTTPGDSPFGPPPEDSPFAPLDVQPAEQPAAQPAADPTPPPAQATSPSTIQARAGSSNMLLYIGLAVGALLIVGAVILLVIVLRRRKEEQEMAAANAGRTRIDPLLASSSGITSYATEVGDMPTLAGEGEDDDEYYDEDDETNLSEPPTAVADRVTLVEGENTQDDEENEEEEEGDGLRLDDLVHTPAKKESELGIDYSDTDSPFSKSQADDVYQTSGNAFAATPPEKVSQPEETMPLDQVEDHGEETIGIDALPAMPVAPKKSERASETVGLDISMPLPPQSSFPDDPESTRPLGIPIQKPAPAAKKESDSAGLDIAAAASAHNAGGAGDDMSFNSLMFGGAEAPTPDKAPAAGKTEDDLTLGTFNQQFSDVMFGSETKVPASSADDDGEKTALLGSLTPPPAPKADDDDGEKTMPVGKPAAVAAAAATGGPKLSMFDRQKQAGTEAMNAGDFAKAVQCFSVAASLKPSDKDIRGLLEEARKKRNE